MVVSVMMKKIFETHAHYDDEAFDSDRDELLSSFIDNGIDRVVNIGASMKSSKNTLELIEKYDFMYGTIGVHPSETGELTMEDLNWLKKAASHEKIVAIGEIGLDYHWDEPERDVQKEWFIKQIALGRELSLPLVIHSREAAKDTLDIMTAENCKEIGGVIHCYSYSKEQARNYLDMGYYFGIGGVLTFKNARTLKETVEYVPMDRMVLETDSPYLTPEPYRGKRNSSLFLPFVVSKIAEIKGISEEEVIYVTRENAMRLYKMEDK